MLLWLIIACEVGFWIVLAAGLLARYVFKAPRTSTVLLVSTPVIDLILLIAVALDLSVNLATATFFHGLAALYIGFTLMFGKLTVRWADRWFAYKFAAGPRPTGNPTGGWPLVRYDLQLFARAVVACAIAAILIAAAIYFVDDPERTAALNYWWRHLSGTVLIWFIVGPLYSAVFKSWARAA